MFVHFCIKVYPSQPRDHWAVGNPSTIEQWMTLLSVAVNQWLLKKKEENIFFQMQRPAEQKKKDLF